MNINTVYRYVLGNDLSKPFTLIESGEKVEDPKYHELKEQNYLDIINVAKNNDKIMAYKPEGKDLTFIISNHENTQCEYWDYKIGEWIYDPVLKYERDVHLYENKITSEIAWVSEEILNLQEMVDYDEADEEDNEHLDLAKRYRVSLNKIKRSNDYPNLEVELPDRPY